MSGFNLVGGFLSLILVFLYIGAIAVSIYCIVLFIKLARRGIKALDIYLDEKSRGHGGNWGNH